MLVVELFAGLGNQMFQLALYRALREMGRCVIVNDYLVTTGYMTHQSPPAGEIFGIRYPRLRSGDHFASMLRTVNQESPGLIRRFVPLWKGRLVREVDEDFNSKILRLTDGYLVGFWQTEEYFAHCREAIVEMFRFPAITDGENLAVLEEIHNSACSVSLHIRRGDYVEQSSIYGGICTDAYYEKAIAYFQNKYPGCTFFLFSDDPAYCEKYLTSPAFRLVNVNDEQNGWKDMYLMTQCSHNIVANSSFSWWGAWLNQNPNKEVIAPARWRNTQLMQDICPQSWLRIKG